MRLGQLALRLGNPDQGRLVGPRLQVTIDAVVAGVEPAADKPFPEWRVAAVQRGVPVLVPAQQVGVLPKALREVLLAEPLQDRRVVRVGLADKPGRGLDVLLLPPVHGDLGLRDLQLLTDGHDSSLRSCGRPASAVVPHPSGAPWQILERGAPAVKRDSPDGAGGSSRRRPRERPGVGTPALSDATARPSGRDGRRLATVGQRWAMAAVIADTVPEGSSTPITSLA